MTEVAAAAVYSSAGHKAVVVDMGWCQFAAALDSQYIVVALLAPVSDIVVELVGGMDLRSIVVVCWYAVLEEEGSSVYVEILVEEQARSSRKSQSDQY